MAKDFPTSGEGGKAASAVTEPEPSTKAEPPKDNTAEIQRLLDDAGKSATAEKPVAVKLPTGSHFVTQALRFPAHVSLEGVVVGTPEEHAKALGGVKTVHRAAVVNGQPASFELYHQFHAAAEALHGWKEHAHHEGKPIQLSADDYQAALKAAAAPVTRALNKDGKPTGEPVDSTEAANKGIPTVTDYEPHKPALSPHRGKGL